MPRLLAAEVEPVRAHALHDVAVADRGAAQFQPLPGQIPLQAEVGHHGRGHGAAAQPPGAVPAFRGQRQDLVAVHQPPVLVGQQQPVGVAVQRQAEVGAVVHHRPAQRLRHGRTTLPVDVEAVWGDAERDDRSAQFRQHRGRDAVGGAVRAVDHDLQPVERLPAGEGGLGALDVAPGCVGDAGGAAQLARRRQPARKVGRHQRLDLRLGRVGQLVAVGAEQLDAVILERVVAGGNHDAEVGPHAAGQHGNGGCGQRAHQVHVHPSADETGDQCRFDHVAGQAGVLADQHAVAMAAADEHQPGGLAEPQRHLGRHRVGVGGAADSIRAEQPPAICHRCVSPCLQPSRS